jgi:hypothetical protein
MSEHISSGTILNAILVLSGEIHRLDERLAREDASEAELESEGEAVLELRRAFGELTAVYKRRREGDPALPELEGLLADR